MRIGPILNPVCGLTPLVVCFNRETRKESIQIAVYNPYLTPGIVSSGFMVMTPFTVLFGVTIPPSCNILPHNKKLGNCLRSRFCSKPLGALLLTTSVVVINSGLTRWRFDGIDGRRRSHGKQDEGEGVWRMNGLTRNGTAEPVSRDRILRREQRQGENHFPCSADHEQDWQPYPVGPYSAKCDDNTQDTCGGISNSCFNVSMNPLPYDGVPQLPQTRRTAAVHRTHSACYMSPTGSSY